MSIGFEDQITKNKIASVMLILVFLLIGGGIAYFIGLLFKNAAYIFFGVVVLYTIIQVINGYYNAHEVIPRREKARPANPEVYEEKYLIDALDGLVLACGLPSTPAAYIQDSERNPNAFACGRDPEHSAICVTRGLLDTLTREELEGVLAHELAHVYNRDSMVSGISFTLSGSIVNFCNGLLRFFTFVSDCDRSGKNGGGIWLVITFIPLLLARSMARLTTFAVSRKREFLADATAVQLTRNPNGLRSALIKICTIPTHVKSASPAGASLYFGDPEKGVKNWWAQLWSTHPTLKQRVAALDRM